MRRTTAFLAVICLTASVPQALAEPAGARTAALQSDETRGPRGHPASSQQDGLPPLKEMMRSAAKLLEEANASTELKGSGPYPAKLVVDIALPNATIYRPADLRALRGRKLGLLIWGNGACANDGASARAHLAEIASHGYLVIAPGKPLTGSTMMRDGPPVPAPFPMTTTIQDLRDNLEWALAENDRQGSPYAGLIDRNALAAAGHSCGGMQAILLADDPRIRTVIIHNSGVNPVIPDNPPLIMDMQRMRGLRGSALFIVGGKSDVLWQEANESYEAVDKIPAAIVSSDVGHGGTFDKPHGGMAAAIAVDWLEWQLRGTAKAGKRFVGADCGLCLSQEWTIRKKNIP